MLFHNYSLELLKYESFQSINIANLSTRTVAFPADFSHVSLIKNIEDYLFNNWRLFFVFLKVISCQYFKVGNDVKEKYSI